MDPQTIVERAKDLGINLTVAGDRIRYAPKSRTPEYLIELLKEHKPELLTFLNDQLDDGPCSCAPHTKQQANSATLEKEETARLLAWASEIADKNLVLEASLRYLEAPPRTVTTTRISWHAVCQLRTIAFARMNQESGGCCTWESSWWRDREAEAIEALKALREAVDSSCKGVGNG